MDSKLEKSEFGRHLLKTLPAPNPQDLRTEADYYGAAKLVVDQNNPRAINQIVVPKSDIGWQHGWAIAPLTDFRQVTGLSNPKPHYLVGTQREQSVLADAGLCGTPVGLPFVYAKSDPIQRVANSILVMPAHGTDHTAVRTMSTDHVEFIRGLRDQFEHVVACVSAPCLKRGLWKPELSSIGVPWIEGADIRDGNALNRMKTIFSLFESMTSNATGSHFAYAACSGCRVSLFGPIASLTVEALADEPYYKSNPDLVEQAVYRTSESCIREHYPHMLCNPGDSSEQIVWGREQVGWSNRRSAKEMTHLLQMGWLPRFRRKVVRSVSKRFSNSAA